MLKILIYAYSQKVRSSRVIAKRCAEDVVFMWLSGVQKPDFCTISDFRKSNIKVLKKLFKQVVQICQRLGMVGLGLAAIDGTKVKAVASGYGARTQDSLKEAPKAVIFSPHPDDDILACGGTIGLSPGLPSTDRHRDRFSFRIGLDWGIFEAEISM
ncbi:transposase [Dehalococcoidia bacterium]|nr:transposase [Dehalococcoidia bacterium]